MPASANDTTTTVAQIRDGERLRGTFLVRRKRLGVGKTGKPWLQLVLGDRSGTVDARVWEHAEAVHQDVQENDLVWVEGQGARFMDQLQIKVFRVQRVDDPSLDRTQFLPGGRMDPARVQQGYERHRDALKHPWLRQLLVAYMDDREWWTRFLRAPAAKSVHHAYYGGLAEHTLSMMDVARTLGEHYSGLDVRPLSVDLLVTGAFLHDTGKVDELNADAGFEYTDEGRLLGHLVQGLDLLDARVYVLAEFPANLHLHLRHLILSHHGEYEFGSPRRPKTIEALLLHLIDNLDSRVEIAAQALRDAEASDGAWTGYATTLGRHLYRRGVDDAES